MNRVIVFFNLWLCCINLTWAQNWSVKISSNVELRTWKLTTKADKEEKSLLGASITLYQGSKIISQGTSDGNGNFSVMVPGNGEYVLSVAYPGCNAKKFSIVTTGVPQELQNDPSWKPSFSIGGFVMAKPFPGIDYSGLQQTLVKVVYEPKIKNFDDDEPYTNAGLGIVMKIASAENVLINNFCNTNKQGDAALAKPDCPLAKMLYEKAIAMIPGEQYPVEQLKKVGDCLKAKEEAAQKAAEAAKAKEEAAADKAAKDQAAKDKVAADKLAKEKAATDKAEKDKAAKDNSVAKSKAATDKAAADKVAKEKAAKEKAEKDKLAKEKAAAEKPKPVAKAETPKPKEMPPPEEEQLGSPDKSDSKHKVPQVLGGSAAKYKEALNKAEGYFKMKRYAEAKTAYEEVLKIKPADPYATNKLAEVNKLLAK